MKSLGVVLVILALCFFVACAVFAGTSYDKYTNYVNDDSIYVDNVNAYVGGDAYNYIINGTYLTAFAVYAVGSALAGIICLISGSIIVVLTNPPSLAKDLNKSSMAEEL